MRAILTVTVDPKLVVAIERIRKEKDLNTSATIEFLLRMGLDAIESGRATYPDSK